MNEPSNDSSESLLPAEQSNDDEQPRFGALQIVEAFTAMRHEWRGQTKESRALVETMQAAIVQLQTLETKLLAHASDRRPTGVDESKPLVQLVVETEHQFSRALAAVTQWEGRRLEQDLDNRDAIERHFAGLSLWARWIARPLLTFVLGKFPERSAAIENAAIEGLNLLQARLRRSMLEREIERVDVDGTAFDATTMHAIGSVTTSDVPSGHVVEQISPAYRWQGQVLRFAEVRVAR